MEKFKIRNWEALLHMIPGLKLISDSLLEDVQTSESQEVLLRRLGVLEDNISSMAGAALQLKHMPQIVEPLVDVFQVLKKHIIEAHRNALDSDYEDLIQTICNVHMQVVTFVQCAHEVSGLMANQNNLVEPPMAILTG